MRDLPEGVHTGIGAASNGDPYRLGGNRREGPLQHGLDRPFSTLALPAAEGAAIVLDT
jgi:hypothetical protein